MPPVAPQHFVDRFVLPWLQGGDVWVGRPFSVPDALGLGHALTTQADLLWQPVLAGACMQRLLRLGILPPVPPNLLDDDGTVTLLLALHDLLFLTRPEAARLRPAVRGGLLSEVVARLLSIDTPDGDSADLVLIGRHAALVPLLHLRRTDVHAQGSRSARVAHGIDRPRAAAAVATGRSTATEVPVWPLLAALSADDGGALWSLLQRTSPLSGLWQWADRPDGGPIVDAADDLARHTALLRRPVLSRIVVRRLLSLDVLTMATRVAHAVEVLLQPDENSPPSTNVLQTWLCLASHLHWLRHILPQTPPPAPVPSEAAPFYALFALLCDQFPTLARPADVAADGALCDRAAPHIDLCRHALDAPSQRRLQELLTAALARPAQ